MVLSKRIVLITLFTVDGVLIVIMFMAIFAMPDFINTKQMCLPSKEGSSLVCGTSQDKLSEYLEQSFDHAYENFKMIKKDRQESLFESDPYLYKKFLTTKPVARYSANSQAKNAENQESSKGMTTVTGWKPDNDLEDKYEFQRLKLTFKDGRIRVHYSGTYLVYSFLDLYEELKPNVTFSNRDGQIMHGIYVFNFTERTEKELVTSCHPHQSPSNRRFNIYSSFVMTLVDLRAGDEVMVKVNDLSLLQYPVFNTFGLNLV